MSNKISRKDRKLKFETLQLHVGQELSLIHIFITNKEKIDEIAKVVGDRHMEIANLADNEKDQTNMSKFLKYYTVFKLSLIHIYNK